MGGELRGEFGGLRGEAERGLLHERAQLLLRARGGGEGRGRRGEGARAAAPARGSHRWRCCLLPSENWRFLQEQSRAAPCSLIPSSSLLHATSREIEALLFAVLDFLLLVNLGTGQDTTEDLG